VVVVMFVTVLVRFIFVMIVGIRFVAEQRTLEFLTDDFATGSGRQSEQRQRFLQLRTSGGDFSFIGIRGREVFETHEVHRRAFQLQLQGLAVERGVQATDTVLMRAEAAVFMIVVVLIGSMGDGQRQQGKRQSEQQTAHGELRE
jgi:hypothetical protein